MTNRLYLQAHPLNPSPKLFPGDMVFYEMDNLIRGIPVLGVTITSQKMLEFSTPMHCHQIKEIWVYRICEKNEVLYRNKLRGIIKT